MQIVEHTKTDVPDLVSFHGTIAQSSQTAPDATLSYYFRRGQPFPNTPALTWSINCENGEILITSATSMSFQASDKDGPVIIKVHYFENNQVEELKWDWSEMQKEVPIIGRDVMGCLYALADGKKEGDGWVGLEDAANHARIIDKFL